MEDLYIGVSQLAVSTGSITLVSLIVSCHTAWKQLSGDSYTSIHDFAALQCKLVSNFSCNCQITVNCILCKITICIITDSASYLFRIVDFLIRHFEPNMHWGYNHHVVYVTCSPHQCLYIPTHMHTSTYTCTCTHAHIYPHTYMYTCTHHTHTKFLTLFTIPYIRFVSPLLLPILIVVILCFVYVPSTAILNNASQNCITTDMLSVQYTIFINFHISHGMHSLQH